MLTLSPATVITTYIRENNGSAVPANSTTIYANTTGYPTPGTYGPSYSHPWVTVPGVPYTLLPGGFDRGIDYARTSIDNVTAMTFPGTDLVVQQPTPYDEWFQLAVYTATPNMSVWPSTTGLTAWPSSMCGTFDVLYTVESVTKTVTSGGEVTTTLSPTRISTGSVLVPSGQDNIFLHTAALFYGQEGVDKLNITYVEPKATQIDKPRAAVGFPTGLRAWLGEQDNVIAKHPYITECWTVGLNEGQPTVHVPVNALTVTSSRIIDVQKEAPKTTSTSAVNPTESARTEIEGTTLDQPPPPPPTTTNSPSVVNPTESARTEVEETTLDRPPPPPPTTSPSDVRTTAESARTEIEGTTLDKPPSPPPSGTITTLDPPVVTTASAPRTENSGSSLDVPPPPQPQPATPTSRKTSLNIPGMTVIQPETEPTTQEGPQTTESRQPKAHTEDRQPVLDAPGQPQPSTNRPSSALPARTSDMPVGKESSDSKPSGVVIVGSGDNDDSEPEPAQGSPGGNNNEQGNNGIGGLISAIQSVASQQTGTAPASQENDDQSDSPALPAAAITRNSSPAPSQTGFVVGSRTLTPGGAAFTQGGSTFSALPSGSGLQVVAQSETLRLDGVVPAGIFAVPGVVQKPDSENEYLVGNSALSVGGSAVTIGKETFSALPSASGVQVVNGNGQTRTQSVVAVASIDSSTVRSGEDVEQYFFGGNTLSAGGRALTVDGKTFSALPSLSGIAVASEGKTSTVSLGGTVDFLTVTGASVSAFATPVLLPPGDDDDSKNQQLVSLAGKTYTARATEGSLLVVDGQTVKPGETTVLHGETVVLSGSKLVVAAEATASSTHGLGDAIISGLGGVSSPSPSSSSSSGDDENESTASSSASDAEETGTSGDGDDEQSAAVPGVQVALGCLLASAAFALALM